MTQNVKEGVKHSTTGKIKIKIKFKNQNKMRRSYATIYKS
jgi:outer membrane lipoprotein-sorting protein